MENPCRHSISGVLSRCRRCGRFNRPGPAQPLRLRRSDRPSRPARCPHGHPRAALIHGPRCPCNTYESARARWSVRANRRKRGSETSQLGLRTHDDYALPGLADTAHRRRNKRRSSGPSWASSPARMPCSDRGTDNASVGIVSVGAWPQLGQVIVERSSNICIGLREREERSAPAKRAAEWRAARSWGWPSRESIGRLWKARRLGLPIPRAS
jgi:hypothetical protein